MNEYMYIDTIIFGSYLDSFKCRVIANCDVQVPRYLAPFLFLQHETHFHYSFPPLCCGHIV